MSGGASARLALIVLVLTSPSPPVVYRCEAARKIDPAGVWDPKRLRDGQWGVVIDDNDRGATVSRCGFARSVGKVTCDPYTVDKVEVDVFIDARKYYVFNSQYDVQVFSDLSFIENNGRGSITYGTCRMTPK
jgi:hypothetical protein